MPPPLPAPAAAPAREQFTDYADWLNPMLVKELRQGMRKNWFTVMFVLVQVMLVGFLGFQLLANATDMPVDIGRMFDGLFWFLIGVLLVFIMPMRGMTAIAEETKSNTLEMVQVTHLNSWRIVFGKWVCLIALMMLVVISLLPYAALRYFFGGVDIVDNLQTLVGMTLASLVISALAIYFSTMPQAARVLPVVVFVVGWNTVGRFLMGGLFGRSIMPEFSIISLVFATAVNSWFALALAASRIAPSAENHALALRSIPMGACIVALVASLISKSSSWLLLVLPMIVWSIFVALTERTSHFPALYRPWVERGPFVRLAGRVLYPGWASGLNYTMIQVALLTLIAAAGTSAWRGDRWQHLALTGAVVLGAFLTPLLLTTSLDAVKYLGRLYLLLMLAGVMWFAGTHIVFGAVNRQTEQAVCDALVPISAAVWCLFGSDSSTDPHWLFVKMITLPVTGIILLRLLIRAQKEFCDIRKLEASARNT